MQPIAIFNQKGGVGKSTTSVNFGAGLVRQGKKVLFVDADSQANLTKMLGTTLKNSQQSTTTDKLQSANFGHPYYYSRRSLELLKENRAACAPGLWQ